MRSAKTAITVLGAVVVLLLAGNTVAQATTGRSLLDGKTSSSGRLTTIKRTTTGPALAVHTRSSGSAPFAVNGTGKVLHLNADRVDGLDSSSLRTHSYLFTPERFTRQSGVEYTLPLPSGSYLITYSMLFSNLSGDDGVECFIQQGIDNGSTTKLVGLSSQVANNTSWLPGLNGTGFVTKTSSQPVSVICNTENFDATFDNDPGTPFQIVATPTTIASSHSIGADQDRARVRLP
ncbi:MAG TPA: hypothetical protein VFE15_10715 [Marmoricola sp.]|jgi:hypothetical protein|nr:hypothetical protein [Marmoricola sp.]